MSVQIKTIIELMQKNAPRELAYSWDNVGLMVGNPLENTDKILLTLDVTDSVIDKAIHEGFNLIISHHPFIFKPLKNVTDPGILKLIQNHITVYSAHTNLDVVPQGVNYALAGKLNLTNLRFIQPLSEKEYYHLVVYTPVDNAEDVLNAVFKAGAGKIGNYSQCSNQYSVQGSFYPDQNSHPSVGEQKKLNRVDELKLEVFCDAVNLPGVLQAMKSAHLYETPAYAVYKLQQNSPNYGLGLYGDLPSEMPMQDFAQFVKKQLQAPFIKLWLCDQDKDKRVKRIAVCGGSGGMILNSIRNADILVTGDITYHQYLDSSLPIIDAGHFYTENPVLDLLEEMLMEFGLPIEKISPVNHDIHQLSVL